MRKILVIFPEFYYTHIDIVLATSESLRGEPVVCTIHYIRRLAATFGAELDFFFSFLFFFIFPVLLFSFPLPHNCPLFADCHVKYRSISPIIAFPSPRIGSATRQGDH